MRRLRANPLGRADHAGWRRYGVGMFGRGRRDDDARATPEVAPWVGSMLRADLAVVTVRRRAIPGVALTSGDQRIVLRADEVRSVVDGALGIAESLGSPLAFLCRPGAASADSPAGALVTEADPRSLVVLAEPMDRIAGSIAPEEVAGFSSWVRSLPR